MRLKIAPLLVGAALTAAPMLSACNKAKAHLYKAEDLFEKRDLKGAQTELEEAIKINPDLVDAHKSLAHIDEFLGDQEGAAKEYDIASRLDPTDSKMMNKARYYHQMQELANSADKALDDIKAGQIEAGINTLKDILTQSKQKIAHDKAVEALKKAGPLIAKQAYALSQEKKYQDAINADAFGLRAYILLAEAEQKQQIDPGADWLMKSINYAAKAGNTPDRPFKILNEVLTVDPENKTANSELAQVYLARNPPDYGTAADLMERAGAPEAQVKGMRAKAKHRAS